MVGKQQIQIAGNQFAQGLATSDYLGDGGIGTSSSNLSMIATPGVVRAMPTSTPTQSGVAISSGIVASCESPEIDTTHQYRWFIDNGGTTLFACSDTAYTDKTGTTFTNVSSPNSDMAVWGGDTSFGYIYISKSNNIIEVKIDTSGNVSATNSTWWSGTVSGSVGMSSNYPHPLLVYEGSLWVGDANLLKSASDRTTAGTTLTLQPTERIQTLAIDPQTGLMMIGVRTVSGNDDTFSTQSFVYLFDGVSSKARRKIPVDGRIATFKNVGGQVYVVMDNFVGVWNGNGVTFLRRLFNVSRSSSLLPYKNRVTGFQNTLLVADGQYVLAYGDIANGKKVWWPFYKHTANIDALFFVGNVDSSSAPVSPLIAVNDGANLKFIRPMDTTTAGTGVLYTNNINFERPVEINRIRVFTTGITTTAGIGECSIIDEKGTTTTPTVGTFKVASGTQYVFDFDFNLKLQTLQPKITIDTQAFGIVRVIIYYTVAE